MTDILAGRYELGAELGAGGMALVREAYDRTLARRVAVKLLHGQMLSQPGMRDRFLREARSAASFQHPHAVAIYDTGRDDGVPYIVMELVEGRTLADVLAERGALRPDEAVAVSAQILSALGAAHRRGLVHRDVKPANVLLPGGEVPSHPAGDPAAKLADFGIAKGLEEAAAGLTATGQVLGTPTYVSPEQVSGQAASPRSDVYSVGVMLYEMLAGRPPFRAESALALALAHREDPVPRLERRVRGLSRDIATIVHRALEKDPAHRFADANEMRAALADPASAPAPAAVAPTAVLGDAGTATRPLPADDGPGERTRAPWRPVALVAALALLLLALVAMDWQGLFDRFASPETDDPPIDESDPDTDPPEPEDTDPEPPEDDPDAETEDPTDEEEPPPDAENGDGPPEDPPGEGPPGDNGPPGQEDPPPGQDEGDGDGEDGSGDEQGTSDEDPADGEGEDPADGEPTSRNPLARDTDDSGQPDPARGATAPATGSDPRG